MVRSAEIVVVPIVVVSQIEAIEADSTDDLEIIRQLHLILYKRRRDSRLKMVVGIGRTLPIRHWHGRGRCTERNCQTRCRVVEEAGFPEVIRQLAPELRANKDCVSDAAGGDAGDQICLIEQILTMRRIVVSA